MKQKSLLITFFLAILSFKSIAQELDHKLASVFIYNFTKYIDWPADHKNGDFVIGVFGDISIVEVFNKCIASKKVGNQPIAMRMTRSMDGIEQCNIVYVSLSESYRLKDILMVLKGKPTLIICEKMGLAKKGASINLFLDEDDDYKTKFEINKKAIEGSGLIISTQLVNLAERAY